MAKASKYTYYPNATVKDELDGSVYTLGSTVESLSIEISGNTHPFYTGQETLIDTAGRIDKFKSRVAAASSAGKTAKVRGKKGKQKQSLADMMKNDAATAKPLKKVVKKKVEQSEEKTVETQETATEEKVAE